MTSITPAVGLTRDRLPFLIAMASRAPSVHNTQPWQFRLRDDVLELRADARRRLRVLDPSGRELHVSCGAALCNLGLGIRRLGLEPRIQQLPDDEDPLLLARVHALPGAAPTVAELRLVAAITRRHSHRGAFRPERPSANLLEELHLVARMEGARLAIVRDPGRVVRLTELAWTAEDTLHRDVSWQGEMSEWARPEGDRARDGVPATAYGTPGRDPRRLPDRDFAVGRGWGRLDTHPCATADDGAELAVLLTAGDGPQDWLRAGRALQHVLLSAAQSWVFASFATQPLEIPEVRDQLRAECAGLGYPQMLFRIGRADSTVQTPRRPVSEILQLD